MLSKCSKSDVWDFAYVSGHFGPIFKGQAVLLLKIEQIGCTETSLINYNHTLRKILKERRSHINLDGSLKSLIKPY